MQDHPFDEREDEGKQAVDGRAIAGLGLANEVAKPVGVHAAYYEDTGWQKSREKFCFVEKSLVIGRWFFVLKMTEICRGVSFRGTDGQAPVPSEANREFEWTARCQQNARNQGGAVSCLTGA